MVEDNTAPCYYPSARASPCKAHEKRSNRNKSTLGGCQGTGSEVHPFGHWKAWHCMRQHCSSDGSSARLPAGHCRGA